LKSLAADLGVSPSTVSAWETGDRFPSPEKLDLLAANAHQPAFFFLRSVSQAEIPTPPVSRSHR